MKFHRQLFFVMLCFFSLLLHGCLHGIRILGIDKFGEKIVKIPQDRYEKELGQSLAKTHDAALNALHAIPSFPQSKWQLDSVMVGLGIEGKIGIANIATFSARPRIRLWFTKDASL